MNATSLKRGIGNVLSGGGSEVSQRRSAERTDPGVSVRFAFAFREKISRFKDFLELSDLHDPKV